MWVATFLGVTFAGVEIGIAIGVGLSFLYVGLKVRCCTGWHLQHRCNLQSTARPASQDLAVLRALLPASKGKAFRCCCVCLSDVAINLRRLGSRTQRSWVACRGPTCTGT